MGPVLKGLVRDGRVEVAVPPDWPDGSEVVVSLEADDAPATPEGIARTLAAMRQLEPLEIPADTLADLDEWERQLLRREADRVDDVAG